VHIITKDSSGHVSSDTTVARDVSWMSVGNFNGGLSLATSGADYSIPAGSATYQNGSIKLECRAMAAVHPPANGAA
jgi:hypothetical protein